MRPRTLPFVFLSAIVVALLAWPAVADAQRRGRARPRPAVRTTIVLGAYVYPVYRYGPYYPYSPWGYWRPYAYGPRPSPIGSLRVDVDPNDAEVFVDGYFAGYVDDFDNPFQRLHVRPGGHEIVVYLEGYRSLRYSLYVEPYSDLHIRDRLVPLAPGEYGDPRPEPAVVDPTAGRAPPERPRAVPRRSVEPPVAFGVERYGSLALLVRPVDATIVVDGEDFTEPTGAARLEIQLTEGRHRIEIAKDGYARYVETVLIQEGRTLTLTVSLTRR
jgi:hypothetical protein